MTYVAAVGAWAAPTVRAYAYIRGTILWWVHVMPVVASSSRCVKRTHYACTCVPEESCPIGDMYVYSRISRGRGHSSCNGPWFAC